LIHVVVTMIIREGQMPRFLELARQVSAEVRREAGCIAYEYTLDVQSPLPTQEPVQANRLTLIEKWESLEALEAHMSAPHMKLFGPRMQPLRESVAIRVTRDI
jgi:quinol monooxygenase YgiN